jgi:hypothetical protein
MSTKLAEHYIFYTLDLEIRKIIDKCLPKDIQKKRNLIKKKNLKESLLPFLAWRTGNVSFSFPSPSSLVYILSCYIKINPS